MMKSETLQDIINFSADFSSHTRYSRTISSNDGCNDNIFMDIKSTADGGDEPHHKYHHLN